MFADRLQFLLLTKLIIFSHFLHQIQTWFFPVSNFFSIIESNLLTLTIFLAYFTRTVSFGGILWKKREKSRTRDTFCPCNLSSHVIFVSCDFFSSFFCCSYARKSPFIPRIKTWTIWWVFRFCSNHAVAGGLSKCVCMQNGGGTGKDLWEYQFTVQYIPSATGYNPATTRGHGEPEIELLHIYYPPPPFPPPSNVTYQNRPGSQAVSAPPTGLKSTEERVGLGDGGDLRPPRIIVTYKNPPHTISVDIWFYFCFHERFHFYIFDFFFDAGFAVRSSSIRNFINKKLRQ